MPIPKRYIHDRLVLLLLSVNAFLTLLGTILIVFQLGNKQGESHIVQYRSNLGLDAFTRGDASPILSFIVFSVLVLVFHTVLSMKTYPMRKWFSIAILGLGTLLLIISVIVSNALLVYR